MFGAKMHTEEAYFRVLFGTALSKLLTLYPLFFYYRYILTFKIFLKSYLFDP